MDLSVSKLEQGGMGPPEVKVETGESMKGAEIKMMSLNDIKLAKNSRLQIKDEDLSGIMQSIKEVGLLQPIGVSQDKKGGYSICYGNRRFLACSKLGLKKIPVIIHKHKSASEEDLKNLTENIQRRNISLVEAGRYVDLLKKQGLSTSEIAVRLGVTKGYVQMTLDSYNKVPDKFKGDIDVAVTKDKKSSRSRGKIGVSTAQRIMSAKATYGLKDKDVDYLFTKAKKADKFNADLIHRYAKKLSSGESDPVESEEKTKSLNVHLILTAREYDRLWTKYVINGKFGWKGLAPLIRAIIAGEIHERIKLLKRNET